MVLIDDFGTVLRYELDYIIPVRIKYLDPVSRYPSLATVATAAGLIMGSIFWDLDLDDANAKFGVRGWAPVVLLTCGNRHRFLTVCCSVAESASPAKW